MKKLLWSIFVLIILLIFIGLSSCLETGDEERPGMAFSADALLTKVWEVEMFQDNGKNKSNLFHGVFLEFRPNFVFKITTGCEILEGEWILSNDSTLLVIRIPGAPEPFNQLEDEWVVTSITETTIHIIEQDNKGNEEFILKVTPLRSLNCHSCATVNDVLTDSVWSITNFVTPSQELTDQSRGAYLDFDEGGEVTLHTYDQTVSGSWVITDQCHTLVIQWFDDKISSKLFQLLEDHWYIHGIGPQSVSLETDNQVYLELAKGKFQDCTELHTNMLNTSWSIEFVSINEDDVSENFWGTGFTFLENNKLATEVLIGPAVLGQWMLAAECNKLNLEIQAGQLKGLSGAWMITELKQEQITLVLEEGALSVAMRLRKGQPKPTANCLLFIDILTNKKWSVANFEENEAPSDPDLLGFQMRFNRDGSLIIWNDNQEVEASWYPIMDCKRIIIDLDRQSNIGKFSGKWSIVKSYNNKMIMVYEKMDIKRTMELAGI